MLDSLMLERAVNELKVRAEKRGDVLKQLTQIGQDALSSLDSMPIGNPSKLRIELKAMDGGVEGGGGKALWH